MQQSSQIHAELKMCANLLEEMAHTGSDQDFAERWQRFLGHLERIWNKCQNHFGKSPKWNGWKGRFEKQRRTDPLLSYLLNARGAHEHTVADITEQTPETIEIRAAGLNGGVHIKHLQIGPNGVQGEWTGDLAVTFIPGKVNPVSVTNRGRVYPVPEAHLCEKLPDNSALTLGHYGLAYYQKFVADADAFFVNDQNGKHCGRDRRSSSTPPLALNVSSLPNQ